jgi:arsenate reductase-like glutaredoxin family protein
MPNEFFPYQNPNEEEIHNEKEKILTEVREFLKKPISEGYLQKILDLLYKLFRKGLYYTKEFATLSNLANKYLKEMATKSRSEVEKKPVVSFEKEAPFYNAEILGHLVDKIISDAEELYRKLSEKGIDDINEADIKEIQYLMEKLESFGLINSLTYTKLAVLYYKTIIHKLKKNKEKEY